MRWLAVWVPLIVVAAAGIIALVTWLINNVWRPFPDLLPFPVVLWSWVALAGLLLAFARQLLLRTWPRRAAAVAAGVLVLAAAANQVNGYFQADPSLRAALGPWLDQKPVFTGTVHAKQVVAGRGRALEGIWDPPRGMPTAGAVYQADIPGITSGFEARPGYIYLPPAYLATPRPQLPVLVLLAGQPGDPRAWVDSGQIQAMMDGFAKRHDGLAPVVVMPDDLGSYFANPLCLNSRLGDAQTYLTVDVPNWITSHLQVRPPGQGWAIGGFSEGGTCAIQLSTQAPQAVSVLRGHLRSDRADTGQPPADDQQGVRGGRRRVRPGGPDRRAGAHPVSAQRRGFRGRRDDRRVHPAAADHVPRGAACGDERDAGVPSRRA